jgi:hypothetical protein
MLNSLEAWWTDIPVVLDRLVIHANSQSHALASNPGNIPDER